VVLILSYEFCGTEAELTLTPLFNRMCSYHSLFSFLSLLYHTIAVITQQVVSSEVIGPRCDEAEKESRLVQLR